MSRNDIRIHKTSGSASGLPTGVVSAISAGTVTGIGDTLDPATGLDFPGNAEANADIRLIFSGANMPPRNSHTVMYTARFKPQLGYYTVTWFDWGDETFHNTKFEYGCHPHPNDGTYNGIGQVLNYGGESGTTQYFELGGINGEDVIAMPMEPAFLINDPGEPTSPAQAGLWLTCAHTCEPINAGADLRHRVYPDIVNNPTLFIERIFATSLMPSPSTPRFYYGSSAWTHDTPTSDRNTETPCCILRGLRIFDVALGQADLEAEAAAVGTDAPGSANGAASVWYINDNPTPTDTDDVSGEGHDPVWAANGLLPGLWEE